MSAALRGPGAVMNRQRTRELYATAALITFNTLALFVLINLVLAGVLFVRDRLRRQRQRDPRVSWYREKFSDLEAYSRVSREVATALLDEQDALGSIGLKYAPWVQLRHAPFEGRFLNTDDQGFRKTPAAPPPERARRKLYLFGGSVTFGYGVPDEHTIPNYLQKIVSPDHPDVVVRNLGQALYYSSQEMILLLLLVKQGDVPNWAVFIDGINDTTQLSLLVDQAAFTPHMEALWDAKSSPAPVPWRALAGRVPMVRAANRVLTMLTPKRSPAPAPVRRPSAHDDQRIADYIVNTYLQNVTIIKAVCREYGIQCRFVW